MRVLKILVLILFQCCFIDISYSGRFVGQLQIILFKGILTNNIETNLGLLIIIIAQISIIVSALKQNRATDTWALTSVIILTFSIVIDTIHAIETLFFNCFYLIAAAIYFIMVIKNKLKTA